MSIEVHSDWFRLAPLCSALPFIRRAHIRFRLYHWLHGQFTSHPNLHNLTALKAKIDHISKLLAKARCLQSLKLIWTETAIHPLCIQGACCQPVMRNVWKSYIDMVLQPLTTIQPSCTVIKGDIVVRNMQLLMQPRITYLSLSSHPTDMENAFSSAIDKLLVTRASSAQ